MKIKTEPRKKGSLSDRHDSDEAKRRFRDGAVLPLFGRHVLALVVRTLGYLLVLIKTFCFRNNIYPFQT